MNCKYSTLCTLVTLERGFEEPSPSSINFFVLNSHYPGANACKKHLVLDFAGKPK